MPSLRKLLSKFNKSEQEVIEFLIESVISLNWKSLDVRKLKGHQNTFRIRKGDLRIIFIKDKKDISILAIERRNDKTYK